MSALERAFSDIDLAAARAVRRSLKEGASSILKALDRGDGGRSFAAVFLYAMPADPKDALAIAEEKIVALRARRRDGVLDDGVALIRINHMRQWRLALRYLRRFAGKESAE